MDSTKESTKISITIVSSLLVGAIAMILIYSNVIPLVATSLLIPVIAYVISVIMSIIYQYSTCKKISAVPILIGDSAIALTTGAISGLLFLETIPIFKYIFGPYAPRNPITGLPYTEGSEEYIYAFDTENHYKLQFFSGIVKAVIPVYFPEGVKSGLVYLYWMFWMTLLPQYFMLSVQGIC
jgi:hypothetical protein